jgi:lipid II:glycine glycyltransferase (peptidoglycan interpeptide bridge formation enzyme)
MKVQEIDSITFDTFAHTHIMKNYYQSTTFGNLMKKTVFDVMYIGVFEENILKCAALILYKNIAPGIKYGYSPRGFLIDYYNKDLLLEVTKRIKDFFFRKGFAFIKVNPEITYSVVDYKTKDKSINSRNNNVIDFLTKIGYRKMPPTLNFESLLTRYNPIINLKSYDMNDIDELLNSKITINQRKSLRAFITDEKDIEQFYSFFKTSKIRNFNKYKLYYNVFKEKDMIDLLLIEVDYNEMLKALQRDYHLCSVENTKVNEEFKESPSNLELYNKKMQSDKKLNDIHHNIISLTNILQQGTIKEIIAGSLLIKYEGRVNILLANYKKNFKELDIKFFLYYTIIDKYKSDGYKFIDLNGMSGDFSDNSPFKNLNEFKLQFNPVVYEYIGEFDLVINNAYYQLLSSTGVLKSEFNKEEVK